MYVVHTTDTIFLRDFVGIRTIQRPWTPRPKPSLKGAGRRLSVVRHLSRSGVVDCWWAMKIEGIEVFFWTDTYFHLIDGIKYGSWGRLEMTMVSLEVVVSATKKESLSIFSHQKRITTHGRRLANSFWQVRPGWRLTDGIFPPKILVGRGGRLPT